MKLLHGSAIKKALRDVAPQRIAVAYAGKDWAEYITRGALEEIIISPTIGSNPFAISALVTQLGWEHVHFLDNLHAKLYLGKENAALGSFNLTANGLSAEGLEEAGYLVTDPEAIGEIRQLYESYLKKAQASYPTTQAKVSRLKALHILWGQAARTGVISDDAQGESLSMFLPFADSIYICGVAGECGYNEEVVDTSIINQSMTFLEDDEIARGKWILCWYSDKHGFPRPRTTPYWVRVDEVFDKGADDQMYSKLAVERNDQSEVAAPFDLTPEVVRALYATLRISRFEPFLWLKDPWPVAPTLPLMSDFLHEMERHVRSAEVQQVEAAIDLDVTRRAFDTRVRQSMQRAFDDRHIRSSILEMLANENAVEVARRVVVRSQSAAAENRQLRAGLKSLATGRVLDLSIESIMLEDRFKPLFSKTEQAAALTNLYEADPTYKVS
jgi:hypothetical protein